MTTDPIVALESLGYTEREAAFLFLVAVHSGYFLRRQFDYFIDRNRGGTVLRFLEKARINGHIKFLDPKHGRQVYHLFYKSIYRLLGAADSQNRRVKGDARVRASLMKLDYVLENDQERYLETDEEKFRFFTETRGLDSRMITEGGVSFSSSIQSALISIADRTRPATALVRFVFIDEGMLTVAKFDRFLESLAPLLRAVAYFELVYVATSDHNFRTSAALFRNQFAGDTGRQQELLNPEWQRSTPRNGPSSLPLRAQFTTMLLRFSYPSLQRNELRCSAGCSAIDSGAKQ